MVPGSERIGDHLRVCGADPADSANVDADWGSPPRVRSRRNNLLQGSNPRGITSACAEQTSRAARCSSAWRDHLRVCGADWCEPCHRRPLSGSPPRVRSRRTVRCGSTCRGRITSACAEQTGPWGISIGVAGDHLRVCGADGKPYDRWEPGGGSSPRVRSRPHLGRGRGGRDRIISACAEQTSPRWTSVPAAGDHLRVCGADRGRLVRLQGGQGSSLFLFNCLLRF